MNVNRLLLIHALNLTMALPSSIDKFLAYNGVPKLDRRNTGAAKNKRKAEKRKNKK